VIERKECNFAPTRIAPALSNSKQRSEAIIEAHQYFHRYTDDALDLCDVLGSYVPGVKVKLDEVSKILGLTGKPDEINGSRVEEMVRAGQIEEVAAVVFFWP
jgi:predicted PolB exonuclease-like 3'-5' exonuclease